MSAAALAANERTAYGYGVRLFVVRAFLAASGLLGFACSGSTAPYTADADRGSTHALVTIERRDAVGQERSEAKAFASFVRTPPEVDVAAVTRITGLDLNLPDIGECSSSATNHEPSVPLSPLRRVELLAAGEVTLETPEGRVPLAPRAFPAVTDLVAGVVYATQDRAAALPASEPYALSAAGSSSLPAFSVSVEAPAALEAVMLDGTPFGPTSALLPGENAITWRPGSARDLVYITVSDANAVSSVCTFKDEAGKAVLPASIVPRVGTGPAALSVHRLRTVALGATAGGAIDAGQLRFDFELTALVTVAEH